MLASRWTAIRPHDLVVREWDEYGAVYDLLSGSTHVLNVLGLEILNLLSGRAAGIRELAQEFADAMPIDLDHEAFARQIEQQLQLLQELQLVQPESRQS